MKYKVYGNEFTSVQELKNYILQDIIAHEWYGGLIEDFEDDLNIKYGQFLISDTYYSPSEILKACNPDDYNFLLDNFMEEELDDFIYNEIEMQDDDAILIFYDYTIQCIADKEV